MITLLNGRRFFIENENWPGHKGDTIAFDADKIYELHVELQVMPTGKNQLQCTCEKVEKSPFRAKWISLQLAAIATIEKVGAESFIWQSVMKAKSNLVLPNVQEIAQGRQKFGKVK
jgi:hypothetical protein